MEFGPIISAMRRNKVGAILIAVQMAITLAIMCNALFIIEQRVALSKRPTGADEANVLVIRNQWVGNPPDASARMQGDLAALRALPGVQDAVATNSFPMSGGGSTEGLNLHEDQKDATALAALYFGDEHAIAAFGLKLVAGRNFNSGDVVDKAGYTDLKSPTGIIVTRVLADKLFPDGNAVGQSVYGAAPKGQTPIIGIVERLQVPWVSAGGWGSKFNDSSMIEPFNLVSVFPFYYVVHTQPGQMNAVLQSAPKKLFDISRARIIEKTRGSLQGRQRLGGHSQRGLRGAAGGHRVRDRGSDELLGRAAAAPDRHPPGLGRHAQCHRSILPDRESFDRGRRRRDRRRFGRVAESLDGQCLCDAALEHELRPPGSDRGAGAGTSGGALAGTQSGVNSAGVGNAGRVGGVIPRRTR